ncbi:hypothetical protein [Methanobrevibacter arboriphilus]|uniref:hypothetical protein n=1 Tax=Methanobrevibacter arboriphilus TaxID=39441 RepID=UPI000A875EBF|nr:hypothetical protein [Methanobrevibacter arboriphilus]
MNKMYIIPIVSLFLLAGLLFLGFFSASGVDSSNENSFLGNFGSSDSEFQIVEVGGYQFKIPIDLKFDYDNFTNDDGFSVYTKSYSIDGKNPTSKGLWIMVWKDYPHSLSEISNEIFLEKGFYPQKISISGHSAIKYTTNQKGESIYAIQVNNDIVSVYICGYSNELNLVETILSLVFSDSNNKFGENSQSSDSSSDEDNSTNDSDSKKIKIKIQMVFQVQIMKCRLITNQYLLFMIQVLTLVLNLVLIENIIFN